MKLLRFSQLGNNGTTGVYHGANLTAKKRSLTPVSSGPPSIKDWPLRSLSRVELVANVKEKRHNVDVMPQNSSKFVKSIRHWGKDFMGPFTSSRRETKNMELTQRLSTAYHPTQQRGMGNLVEYQIVAWKRRNLERTIGSGYQQKDRKPSQNDKTEHGMEKTDDVNQPTVIVQNIEKIDEKTDVYAYGVLLLEIITRRPAVDESQKSLVMCANPLIASKNFEELLNAHLSGACLQNAKSKQIEEEADSQRDALDTYFQRRHRRLQESQERAELLNRANGESLHVDGSN
ncbi:receptor-like cytosolic serine/threonine-protein kinase RBK2 isoform X1 [Tanacetum coccineum]